MKRKNKNLVKETVAEFIKRGGSITVSKTPAKEIKSLMLNAYMTAREKRKIRDFILRF